VKDAPVKSVQITSTEKVSILLWNMPENPLNIAILPVKTTFSTDHFSHYWHDFW